MKLRFEVDQAESFRRGVDCPKRLVTVEVDPANLTQALREGIANRMIGNTVHMIHVFWDLKHLAIYSSPDKERRLIAPLPTWEAFLESLEADSRSSALEVNRLQSAISLLKKSKILTSLDGSYIVPSDHFLDDLEARLTNEERFELFDLLAGSYPYFKERANLIAMVRHRESVYRFEKMNPAPATPRQMPAAPELN